MSHDHPRSSPVAGPSSGRTISTPSPPKHNGSFANLAKLLKLDSFFSTVSIASQDMPRPGDLEDDDEDDDVIDESGVDADADEESLLWDAQTALIAHQPALALERYKIAALPPHRSPAACLALGNLMTRGTSFAATATSPISEYPERQHSGKGKGKEVDREDLNGPGATVASRLYTSIFGPTSPNSPTQLSPLASPSPEKKFDLVRNGWAIRKEGKRAVRNVEGMGVAGGWYVLGIGWVLDKEAERHAVAPPHSPTSDEPPRNPDDDEDALIIVSKSRGGTLTRSSSVRPPLPSRAVSDAATSTIDSIFDSSYPSTANLTVTTNTTASDPRSSKCGSNGEVSDNNGEYVAASHTGLDTAEALVTTKLIYDLLQPLLSLYRHGHIQAADPVYLPPITSSQLPAALRPNGDLQKRRNAWALGGVVAENLLALKGLQVSEAADGKSNRAEKELSQIKLGVSVLANYMAGMTVSDRHLGEMHFRSIVMIGPCGLRMADELVHQASMRLDIIAKSPSEPPTPATSSEVSKEAYPFPRMTPVKRKSKETKRKMGDPNSYKQHHSRNDSSLTVPRPQSRRRRGSRASITLVESQGITPSPAKPLTSSNNSATEAVTSRAESPIKSGAAVELLRSVSAGSPQTPEKLSSSKHLRNPSVISTTVKFGANTPSPLKSVHSTISLDTETACPSITSMYDRRSSAAEILRDVNLLQDTANDITLWPNLAGWTMKKSPPLEGNPMISPPSLFQLGVEPATELILSEKKLRSPNATIRAVSSSLNISNGLHLSSHPVHKSVSSLQGTSKPSSASLLCSDQNLASMDPTFAAAELASALTKHTPCSVCNVNGVNFPECRKCGMRFCSRDCRVGEQGAGNGKRHLCGVWESRQRHKDLEGMKVADHVIGKTSSASPVRAF